MDGEVMQNYCEFPSLDNAVVTESDGDWWAFKKHGMIEKNAQVNLSKKEITFDMTENAHHIYNQMSNVEKDVNGRKKKMC